MPISLHVYNCCSFVTVHQQVHINRGHVYNVLHCTWCMSLQSIPLRSSSLQCCEPTKTCLVTQPTSHSHALGHLGFYWPNRPLMLSTGLPPGLGRLSATSPALSAALPKSGPLTSVALLTPRSVPGACWPAVLGLGSMLLSRGEVICTHHGHHRQEK